MKILHHIDTYLPLTCNWVYNHVVFNTRFEHRISCLQLENQALFQIDSNTPFSFNNRPLICKIIDKICRFSFDEKFQRYFEKVIHKEMPDLVHAHFGYNGFSLLKNKKEDKFPLVTSFYGADISQVPNRDPQWISRYSQLFEHGEAFIVEGPYMKKQLLARGCNGSKIYVNRLGVDLDRIKYSPRTQPQESVNILIAGTFREKKGIPYALEALGLLKESSKNIRIDLVGDETGKEGDAEEKLNILSTIERYKLSDVVTMHGFVTNEVLHQIAEKCHIFLSPSVQARDGDNEGGCPVAIIEMAASGMPVVSTKHCDIPQAVIHGYNGYLCDERNIEQITASLKLFVDNPRKIEEFGSNGRKHVEEFFDVRKQANELGEIYRRIISTFLEHH